MDIFCTKSCPSPCNKILSSQSLHPMLPGASASAPSWRLWNLDWPPDTGSGACLHPAPGTHNVISQSVASHIRSLICCWCAECSMSEVFSAEPLIPPLHHCWLHVSGRVRRTLHIFFVPPLPEATVFQVLDHLLTVPLHENTFKGSQGEQGHVTVPFRVPSRRQRSTLLMSSGFQ